MRRLGGQAPLHRLAGQHGPDRCREFDVSPLIEFEFEFEFVAGFPDTGGVVVPVRQPTQVGEEWNLLSLDPGGGSATVQLLREGRRDHELVVARDSVANDLTHNLEIIYDSAEAPSYPFHGSWRLAAQSPRCAVAPVPDARILRAAWRPGVSPEAHLEQLRGGGPESHVYERSRGHANGAPIHRVNPEIWTGR